MFRHIKFECGYHINETYETNEQQDVAEFLLGFLNCINEIYVETFIDDETPIVRSFSIIMSEHAKCIGCSLEKVKLLLPEKILCCPVPSENEVNVTIEEIISRKLQQDYIKRRCYNCVSDSYSVYNQIEELSRVLIIQINRFLNDMEKNRS